MTTSPSSPIGIPIYAFYNIIALMRGLKPDFADAVSVIGREMRATKAPFDEEAERLVSASKEFASDVKARTRRKVAELDASLDRPDPSSELRMIADGGGFLVVVSSVLSLVAATMNHIARVAESAVPEPVVMSDTRASMLHDVARLLTSKDASAAVGVELQVNMPAVSRFVESILALDRLPRDIIETTAAIESALASYHEAIHRRHTVDGIKVHGDPLVTDVAMAIERNVDRSGEIMEGGRAANEISAWSRARAVTLARAVRSGALAECLREPHRFMDLVRGWLSKLYDAAAGAHEKFAPVGSQVLREIRVAPSKVATSHDFRRALDSLSQFDPGSITYREPTEFASREERRAREYENETLAHIVELLRSEDATPDHIIDYVLSRKAERRRTEVEERCFYTARVGSGNPFMGVAPGALEVYPADRPRVKAADVVGGGYAEVAEHFDSLALSTELDGLFAATHPTKTGEKSHGLLIGPPGCGKTEMLRALGGRDGSIGIFVTGSDFQTCWMGEASKNPKRLFNKAIELSRAGNKPRRVYILIDEIDNVLREPEDEVRSASGANLVNEFLQLLDGVVDYPLVSLWGATNHPERISTRMMRRFQFVRIVGEMTVADRSALLRRFFSHLPTEIDDRGWDEAAEALGGAVGDVIRKIAEDVWRAKMTAFARRDRAAALKVAAAMKDEEGDMKIAADLNREGRRDVAKLLRPHFVITSDDLQAAVRAAVRSPVTRQEIDTAVASYARARAFLASL